MKRISVGKLYFQIRGGHLCKSRHLVSSFTYKQVAAPGAAHLENQTAVITNQECDRHNLIPRFLPKPGIHVHGIATKDNTMFASLPTLERKWRLT